MTVWKILGLIVLALLAVRAFRLVSYSVYETMEITDGALPLLLGKVGKERLYGSCAANLVMNLIFLGVIALAMATVALSGFTISGPLRAIIFIGIAAASLVAFLVNKKVSGILEPSIKKVKLTEIKIELKDKYANSLDNSDQAVMLMLVTVVWVALTMFQPPSSVPTLAEICHLHG